MKLAIALMFLVGCGDILAPSESDIPVLVKPGESVQLDGYPTMPDADGVIQVGSHHDHVLVGYIDGNLVAACRLTPDTHAGYVILDILAFETVVPLVVDLMTDGWGVIPEKTCDLRGPDLHVQGQGQGKG